MLKRAFLFTGLAGAFLLLSNCAWEFSKVLHDKEVNANSLERLWAEGRSVPMGVVVPANNRWAPNAFVSEPSPPQPGQNTHVLILDDHYRGDDQGYRTPNGIIGDDISHSLLCSLPQNAAIQKITIDAIVLAKIRKECAVGTITQ